MDYYNLKESLRQEVMQRLDFHKEWEDDEIADIIDDVILKRSRELYMSTATKLTLKQELFNAIRRLDILQELIDDQTISEIMVNGAGNIFYEKGGRIYKFEKKFDSPQKLEDVIQQIVARANRHVNEASPIVDTSLAAGSRVNIVLKPVALNGPILTIRKFPEKAITMERLIEWDSISGEAAAVLEKLVRAGYNIFVSGGTGTGKTTLLNALADYIPKEERVITIEDTAELQIRGVKNLVRLEVRNSTADGTYEVTIRDLIKSALRMRPDRIVVGEIRGAEAIDMLQAMNTGHDGSLSTGHANSIEDMLSRIETMVMMGTDIPVQAIRKQIASSIDIVIQLGRLRDKSRRVVEIAELNGIFDGEIAINSLYKFREDIPEKSEDNGSEMMIREDGYYENECGKVLGHLVPTGNGLIHKQKLMAANIRIEELDK